VPAPNEHTIRITAETAGYDRAVDQSNRKTDQLGSTMASVGQKGSRAFNEYEKGATRAARATSDFTGQIAKGVLAGSILSGGLQGAVEAIRGYVVEAGKLAARNETLSVVQGQLARTNNLNEAAVARVTQRIKDQNITTQQATDTVNKMIASQLDLSKAVDLARLSQDAAVISGKSSSEALEGIINGIVTQQVEVLRTYGINVTFERRFAEAARRLGRDLTDLERKNIALNTVLERSSQISGAYQAALGTVGKQLSSLQRIAEEAKYALGQRFMPEVKAVVTGLTDMAGWVGRNTDTIKTLVQVLGAAATIGAFVKMAEAISSIGTASLVARNPLIALIALGTALAGIKLYEAFEENKKFTEDYIKRTQEAFHWVTAEVKTVEKQLKMVSGETITLNVSKKIAGELDKAAKGLEDALGFADRAGEDFTKSLQDQNEKQLEQIRADEAMKLSRDIAKRQKETVERTLDAAVQARRQALQGPAQVFAEIQERALKERSYVDEKGISRLINLLPEAQKNLREELKAKLGQLAKEEAVRYNKVAQEVYEANVAAYSVEIGRRADVSSESEKIARDADMRRLEFQQQIVNDATAYELNALESLNARTVQDKLAIEARKLDIQKAGLLKQLVLRSEMLGVERDLELADLDNRYAQKLIKETDYQARRAAVEASFVNRALELDATTAAAIAKIQQDVGNRSVQIVRDNNERVFSSLKQQAGGVFDALTRKSESVWAAIGNSFKTAMLTAIKDVVTSRVAALLAQLVTGQQVKLAGGGGTYGGGGLSKIAAALGLGAVPVFGGGGGAAGGGGGFSIPGLGGGAPGGTSGFSGPVQLGGAGGSGGGFAGLLGAGSAQFGGLREMLGLGSSISTGAGSATTLAAASFGQKLSALGKSNASLFAGAGLAIDGLRRGGLTGLAETTAGGALIGFRFGGPIGALIGGGIGAAAGIVRLFVKGAEEKIIEKVKSAYGITIPRSFARDPLLNIIKSQYGGAIDVGIRSQQVKDLIELYAMSTGQNIGGAGLSNRPVALGFGLGSSGALSLNPVFQNGSQVSLSQIAGGSLGTTATLPAQNSTIQLDADATVAFLTGQAVEVISEQPRVVANAVNASYRQNAGRTRDRALMEQPGLLPA
jgi:hypothetical protein